MSLANASPVPVGSVRDAPGFSETLEIGSARFALYVHVPYCRSKCPYCDFNSYASPSWPEPEYVDALCAELEYRSEQAPWRGSQVATIFFGGGTPSLFNPGSIGRVIATANHLFGIEANAEITLEANPGTVDLEKLRGFRSAGVNRMSFGAQSFRGETLIRLGRTHSPEETVQALGLARQAGFEQLNLDLIFAVPGQALDDVAADLRRAAELSPDHISAYNLTFEDGTPFGEALRRGRLHALDSDLQGEMYALVRSTLPGLGYRHYEISNYARPGCEARHNLAYWHYESYLGIGAGAHSFARANAGGRRWWNERGPRAYMVAASGEGSAEAGSESIDGRTAAGEFVFLNLRLTDGFALEDFAARFGERFETAFSEQAACLTEAGMLLVEGGRVRLTERGLELADSVFANFV